MHSFGVAALASCLLISVSAASAADLNIPAPEAVYEPDIGSRWDGLHIGVHAGIVSGTLSYDEGANDLVSLVHEQGGLIGASIGADWALANGLVVGVVGDLSYSTLNFFGDSNGFVDIDWQGSLRGRVGIDGGAFLPYLTGGIVFASVRENYAADIITTDALVGWTVGTGLEVALNDELSADIQYRYSDFGQDDENGGADGLRTHQLTAGLNWRF